MQRATSLALSLPFAAAALSSVGAYGQCLASYQTIAGADVAPAATFWASDLDDDTSEMAILGAGGRVFVGMLDPGTQRWAAAPTEIPPMNPPTGATPTAGTLALDGDYLVVSLQYPAAGGTYNAPGFVAIYVRNSMGAWTGPVGLNAIAQYDPSPWLAGGLVGARTDHFGSDLEVRDQGGTAHVFIGDPGVRPPSAPTFSQWNFTDGAFFSVQVTSTGGVLSNQRVYRPQWGGTSPPGNGLVSGSNFGASLDLDAAGGRLAVGAPRVGRNNGQTTYHSASAFSYNVFQNAAGEIAFLSPDQTTALGLLPVSIAEDGFRNGTHVATNGSWLTASSYPTGSEQTYVMNASGATTWTTNQVISGSKRAVLSDTHLVASAGYAAELIGSSLVPISGQGDQPTVNGVGFSINNLVVTSSLGGDIRVWRTDCSGDLLSYSGVADAYCAANNNSTGFPAVTSAMGSYLVSDNDMTLRVTGLPQNEFGYFLVSDSQTAIPGAGGSAGILCLGSPLGRYNQQVQNSGASGSFELAIDLTVLPLNPPTAVMSGDTYNFQAWSRDGGTSNFSLPFEITFE